MFLKFVRKNCSKFPNSQPYIYHQQTLSYRTPRVRKTRRHILVQIFSKSLTDLKSSFTGTLFMKFAIKPSF